MRELITKTMGWHKDRLITINGNSMTQFLKLQEEAVELGKGIDLQDKPEIIDAIGDMLVVLISIATLEGLDIEDCLESAFDEIKDRTGKLNKNGDFIKDTVTSREEELEIALDEILNRSDGFTKHDKDKLRYELIPPEAMKALAEVLTFGADKYSANNWRQCSDTTRYLGALMRHIEAFRMGEITDPESGLPHLSHAMTNLAFMIALEGDK